MLLAADIPTTGATWQDVIIGTVPVALALIALFSKRVRGSVEGSSEPPKPPAAEPGAAPAPRAPIAEAVSTVTATTELHHMMVMDLQRRLDEEEKRTEKLSEDLAKANRQIADLRVTQAQLESRIHTLMLGGGMR